MVQWVGKRLPEDIPLTHMPILESPRLLIRPFVMADLAGVHRLLDVELAEVDLHQDPVETLSARQAWLQWSVLNYEQLARLRQPPYGDRAVVLKATGELIGACGFVPCLAPFAQVPGFAAGGDPTSTPPYTQPSSASTMRFHQPTSAAGMPQKPLRPWSITPFSTCIYGAWSP